MAVLRDRVAIVTGAAHGIGRAICASWRARARACWARDVRAAELEATRRRWRRWPRDRAARQSSMCAIRRPSRRSSRGALEAGGRIDILVNTAGGVAGQTMQPVEEVSDADWREIFAINLDGAFHFTRAVAPAMKRQSRAAPS